MMYKMLLADILNLTTTTNVITWGTLKNQILTFLSFCLEVFHLSCDFFVESMPENFLTDIFSYCDTHLVLSFIQLWLGPVKRIYVFEHSVVTNFNCAYPANQRDQGSGFLPDGSSWLTACMSEQRRFWQDSADAQARLNHRCSHRR